MSNRGVAASSLVLFAAMLATAALLYCAPEGFTGVMGLGREGADVFGTALFGRPFEPLASQTFIWCFRGLLILSWCAWIAVVVATFRKTGPATPRTLWMLGGIAVVLALVMPPVLSRDVFGYISYTNLFAAGVNPYTHGHAAAAQAVNDPMTRFLVRYDVPLGYGPLWTLLAAGLNALMSAAGLYAQAVAHKLLGAIALLAIAAASSRLTGFGKAGRAGVTVWAVLLNPLLLIEGPGMGHNDFLMMALAVWSAVSCGNRKWRTGALLLGLAAAVKPVVITALPLLIFERWLRSERPGFAVAELTALAMLPFVVFSMAFGGPVLVVHAILGQANPGRGGSVALAIALAVAVACGLWMVRRGRADAGPAWLMAWLPAAAALVMFGTQYRFPWYAVWLLVPALTGWSERHRILITAASTVALLLSWHYTVG